MILNRHLRALLRRLGLDEKMPPSSTQWVALLSYLNDHFRTSEEEKHRLSRSLEIHGREVNSLYKELVQDRERLSSAVACLTIGFVIFDKNGHVSLMNAEAEQYLGWSESEGMQRNLLQQLGIDEPVTLMQRLTLGQSVDRWLALRTKGGLPFETQVQLQPVLRDSNFMGSVLTFDTPESRSSRETNEHTLQDVLENFLAKASAWLENESSAEMQFQLQAVVNRTEEALAAAGGGFDLISTSTREDLPLVLETVDASPPLRQAAAPQRQATTPAPQRQVPQEQATAPAPLPPPPAPPAPLPERAAPVLPPVQVARAQEMPAPPPPAAPLPPAPRVAVPTFEGPGPEIPTGHRPVPGPVYAAAQTLPPLAPALPSSPQQPSAELVQARASEIAPVAEPADWLTPPEPQAPAEVVAPAPVAIAAPPPPPPAPRAEARPARPPEQPLRVLLVEDEPVSQLVTQSHLEKLGHECVVAADANEAIRLYQRQQFDAIISSYLMPGMNGIDLCRRIREDSRGGYSYFILLTAVERKDEAARALEAGVDAFLTKPLDPNELAVRLKVARGVQSRLSRVYSDVPNPE